MTGSNLMGRKMRLELTTPGTTNRYSNQLSYFRHCLEKTFTKSAAESQAKKQQIYKK